MLKIIVLIFIKIFALNSTCIKHEEKLPEPTTPSTVPFYNNKQDNMIMEPIVPIQCYFVKLFIKCACGLNNFCGCNYCPYTKPRSQTTDNNPIQSTTVVITSKFTTTPFINASCTDIYGQCACGFDQYCNCNCGEATVSPSQIIKNVQNDISLSYFTNSGFKIIYNFPYGHVSVSTEINSISKTCSASSVLCYGCYNRKQPNTLLTIACGNCNSVTTKTTLDKPHYENGVYWYFTPQYSFGYSNIPSIQQGQADTIDQSSTKKVSWHLDLNAGGWRCGNNTWLNNDKSNFYKIILKSDTNSCESKTGPCGCGYDENCNCVCPSTITSITSTPLLDNCAGLKYSCACGFDSYCNCNCPTQNPIIDPMDPILVVDPVLIVEPV